jgi:lipopolysaccharide transport system ATP-binding protein
VKDSSIVLEKVNLHYASVAFAERSLKALLARSFTSPGGSRRVGDIHALHDVSLAIRSGERVGLLGPNGAGKTTLLRAMANLYPVSSGRLDVHGRIRGLFELGLGFEPDATGRENILYRGLLLGQTPREMAMLEPRIVEFADLGEFIDYPLRTYSAGMLVRLAFAISTAVTGDILLIDEVIGAGDAAFMSKARARLTALIGDAQIVVIASHDMNALQTLCTRGIVLDHGRVAFDGPVRDAVAAYLSTVEAHA